MKRIANGIGDVADFPVAFVVRMAAVVCAAFAVSGSAEAQELGERRGRGAQELRATFLNRSFSIEAKLVSRSGPEFLSGLVGKPLQGCPVMIPEPAQTLAMRFRVGGPGPWAGDFDGINAGIKTDLGESGMAFAVPSGSTARLPELQRGPELEFTFDGTRDVQRSLIDAAIRRLDRCLSALPQGSYEGDEIARLCPYPSVTREQAGQTCVPYTSGTLSEPLADGSGYRVMINQGTLCDFVGFNGQASRSTSFVSCFNARYEGVARISGSFEGAATLRAVSSAARRECRKGKRKRSARSIDSCVARVMARSMK